MAKFKPQKVAKRQQVQQALDSDSEDLEDFDDDMLPGSDSSDELVDDGNAAAPAKQRGGAASDIAALAAAAHQQAAAYAARQRKAAAAAAAAAAGGPAVGSDDDALMGSDDDEGLNGLGGGSSEDEEGEDEGEEEGAADGSKRPHIYNADGLHEKLEDIAWIDEQPWRESLVVTAAEATVVEDVDDDLERELAFYNQAMSATAEAITRFQAEGVSWLRPPDYYAEMVKSDEQMARIKDRLMYEQQQIDQATERRKAREQKAYSKQVQAEKQKERAQEKKRQISQVQQLRKQREKSGFAGELDFDAEMSKGGRAGGQQQQQQPRGKGGQKPGQRFNPADRTPGKKRQLKNAKFGFGGKKRLQKQNDSFSAADMSGYKPGRFDDGGRKGGGGRGGGGGGRGGGGKGRGAGPGGPKGGVKKKFGGGAAGNRPGKARRQQQRQRKL